MSDGTERVRPKTRPSLRSLAISSAWFVAILGTLALAVAEPLLGFPVGLGLIFLSILFPGENPCGGGKDEGRKK